VRFPTLVGLAELAPAALLACALLAGGCAGSKSHDLGSPSSTWTPAPGATCADSAQQARAIQAIVAMDDLRDDRCSKRRVTDTTVLDSARVASDVPRRERWTLDRCGKPVSYLLEFSREDSGGVAITVRFE
jgi:hypothetical protein